MPNDRLSFRKTKEALRPPARFPARNVTDARVVNRSHQRRRGAQ